jgi:anti-sigma B factor antagonist
MSLEAKIHTNALGDIVIHLYGDLSLEGQKKLNLQIMEIRELHPYSKITLDLNSLDFVGSSSITTFVDLLKSWHEKEPHKFQVENIKNEFLRLFEVYKFDIKPMLVEGTHLSD